MKKLFSLVLTLILVTSLFGAVTVFATNAGDGMEGCKITGFTSTDQSVISNFTSEQYTNITNWTFPQSGGKVLIGNAGSPEKGQFKLNGATDYIISFKTRASTDAADITYISNSMFTNAVYYANGVQQHTYTEIPSKGKALKITKDGATWDEHKITFTRASTSAAYMFFHIGLGNSGTIEIADFKVQTADEAIVPGTGCEGYTASLNGTEGWSITNAAANSSNAQTALEVIPTNATFTFKKDYEYTISFKLKKTAGSYVTFKSSSYFVDANTVHGWKYWVDGVGMTTPTDKKQLDQQLTIGGSKWETHKITFVSPVEKKWARLYFYFPKGASFGITDFKVEEKYAGPEITIDETNSKFYDDNGTDTAIVYGEVSDFATTAEGEFGVTIETSAGKITLPMMGAEALANIANFKGKKFAIKVYGSAINQGTEYTFVPYFGTWTGKAFKLS